MKEEDKVCQKRKIDCFTFTCIL